MEIRNIAIIAHVDHGKTTLVDRIIEQAKILDERKKRTDLLLDNNDLERERGITIVSKNVSVTYKGSKINVIDTPGHADFGGEVERVLKMADGVLLLVDAFEGPMPQTRFVLGKALELGLTPIVVVNKVDKENCTPELVHEKVFDLMFALDASEEQLDFTTIYGSAKNNWMSTDWQQQTTDIVPLLDAVLETIPPSPYVEGTPQMQITALDYSSFKGRIAIGRVFRGDLEVGKDYSICKEDGSTKKVRIKELHTFEGMGKAVVEKVRAGDICAITGIDDFEIGDTIADLENPEPLERIEVDQPTMSMLFTINNSPFFDIDFAPSPKYSMIAPVPPFTVKIPATFKITSLGAVQPDNFPVSFTPISLGNFNSQGIPAITSTASAPPTPIAIIPRPPAFTV
uniref:GTP-binding protein TypA/BipA-like n=1 Tax=Stylophora pistillata TaxID=50429 RepID=A0A2B4R364_STYPI